MAFLIGSGLAVGCTGPDDGKSLSSTTTESAAVQNAQVGERVVLRNGSSVQVFSYESNVTPSNEFSRPQPGRSFAAIDVEGCAGGQGNTAGVVNPFFFTILLHDGNRLQTSIPVKDPGLTVGPHRAGECVRGFVTYDAPSDVKATAVIFDAPGSSVRWAIP